jgi:hypothetical protein
LFHNSHMVSFRDVRSVHDPLIRRSGRKPVSAIHHIVLDFTDETRAFHRHDRRGRIP